MKELLDRFAEIDANRDGLVDLKEFAQYLNLPVTSHVRHLFSLYDRVSVHASRLVSLVQDYTYSSLVFFLRPLQDEDRVCFALGLMNVYFFGLIRRLVFSVKHFLSFFFFFFK